MKAIKEDLLSFSLNLKINQCQFDHLSRGLQRTQRDTAVELLPLQQVTWRDTAVDLVPLQQMAWRGTTAELLPLMKLPDFTLSGGIGKVVASHAKVARLQDRIPAVAELHRFILCTRCSGGTAHEGGGCDQSIGSTICDAIVRSCCGRLQLGVPHWATSVITASS